MFDKNNSVFLDPSDNRYVFEFSVRSSVSSLTTVTLLSTAFCEFLPSLTELANVLIPEPVPIIAIVNASDTNFLLMFLVLILPLLLLPK